MSINAWVDMLTTGIRTAVGIKIFGPHLDAVREIGMIAATSMQRGPVRDQPTPGTPAAGGPPRRSRVRKSGLADTM